MNKQELSLIHRARILDACKRYGVKSLKLFGSVARGQENSDSDVDFVVEMIPGRSLLDLGGFQSEMEEILRCKVDVVTVKGLNKRFQNKVMQEAVAI